MMNQKVRKTLKIITVDAMVIYYKTLARAMGVVLETAGPIC